MGLRKAWQTLLGVLFEADAAKLDAILRDAPSEDAEFWEALVSIANANLVTGTVWSELERKGLVARLPADTAEYLAAFHDYNRARNAALLGQIHECIEALNAAGIEPMPLKGSAYLVEGLYADPGARFLTDVDLLVPAAAIEEAIAALQTIGFATQTGGHTDFATHHHVAPLYREADSAFVDLHRAPVLPRLASALTAQEIWSRARQPADGGRYRLLTPTDAAMLSFLHAEAADRHLARFLIPVRAFCDLTRLQATHADRIDWHENLRRAERIGAGAALRRYLHHYRRISGAASGVALGANRSDGLHFVACAAAAASPLLTRWILRVDRWSRRDPRDA